VIPVWIAPAFLDDYRSMRRQTPRLERILAIGRASLAVSALIAIYFDPTEPARFAALTYALLAGYAVYSLLVLLLVQPLLRLGSAAVLGLHGLDILWASAITVFSQGPVSPFFLFFLFVLLAAAYRWGFRETFATALLVVAIFLVETAVAVAGPWSSAWVATVPFEPTPIVTRITYLLLTGGLLAYLAEEDKQLRAEVAAGADAVRQVRVDLGFGGSVIAIARLLARMFRASSVDIVVHDHERGRTTRWSLGRHGVGRDDSKSPRPVQIMERDRPTWLFDGPARAWCTVGASGPDGWPVTVLDPPRPEVRSLRIALPPALVEGRAFTSLAVVEFGLPGEWQGRLFLFDATPMPRGLHVLDALADQVTPVLSNVFLLRRLRLRAGAAERAKVARELHDGSIQALIGIEMETAALRRVADREASSLIPQLARVQELLRQEITGLRELMQQLQPVDLDASHHLPDVLAALVERFRRDSGIAARFVSDASTSRLALPICHEIVRIVQEALVNARRHSRASNVLVRFVERETGFTLAVEDDGRGFDFEGRLAGPELAARRIGPAIIQQRARMIGATLAIESTRGAGARLEVTFDAA
jgi:signal transduction histidine kinase